MKNNLVKYLVITNILIVLFAITSAKPKPPPKHNNALHHSEKQVHVMVDVNGQTYSRMHRSVANQKANNSEHLLAKALHTEVTNQSISRFVKSLLKKLQDDNIRFPKNDVSSIRIKREDSHSEDIVPKKRILLKPANSKRRDAKKDDTKDISIDKTHGKIVGRKLLSQEEEQTIKEDDISTKIQPKTISDDIKEETKNLENAEIGKISARVQLSKQELQIPVTIIQPHNQQSEIATKIQAESLIESLQAKHNEEIAPKIQTDAAKTPQHTNKEVSDEKVEIASRIQADITKEEVVRDATNKEDTIVAKIQTEEKKDVPNNKEEIASRILEVEVEKDIQKTDDISAKIQANESSVAKEKTVSSRILPENVEKESVKTEVISAKIQTEDNKDSSVAKEDGIASRILHETVEKEAGKSEDIAAKIQTEDHKEEKVAEHLQTGNKETIVQEEIGPRILEEKLPEDKAETVKSDDKVEEIIATKIQTENKEETVAKEESVVPKIQTEEQKEVNIATKIQSEDNQKESVVIEESGAPKIRTEDKEEESITERIQGDSQKAEKGEEVSIAAKIQSDSIKETAGNTKKEESIAARIQEADSAAAHAKDEEKIAAKLLNDNQDSSEGKEKKELRRNIQKEQSFGEDYAQENEYISSRLQSEAPDSKIRKKLSRPKKRVVKEEHQEDSISARIQAAANEEVAKIVTRMQSFSDNDENISSRIQAAIDKEVANLLARIKADQENIEKKASKIDNIASRMQEQSVKEDNIRTVDHLGEDGGVAPRIQLEKKNYETSPEEQSKKQITLRTLDKDKKNLEIAKSMKLASKDDVSISARIQEEAKDQSISSETNENIASRIQSDEGKEETSKEDSQATKEDEFVAQKIQRDNKKSKENEAIASRIQAETEHGESLSSKSQAESSNEDESIASRIQSDESDVSKTQSESSKENGATKISSKDDESVASRIQSEDDSEDKSDATKSDASKESVASRMQASESEANEDSKSVELHDVIAPESEEISSRIHTDLSKDDIHGTKEEGMAARKHDSNSASVEGMISSRIQDASQIEQSGQSDVSKIHADEKSAEQHIEEIASRMAGVPDNPENGISQLVTIEQESTTPATIRKRKKKIKIIRMPVRLAFSRLYDFQDEDVDDQSLIGRFEKSIMNEPFINVGEYEVDNEKHKKCTTQNCVINMDKSDNFHKLDAGQMDRAKSLMENLNDTHFIQISLRVSQFPFHLMRKRESNDTKAHHECAKKTCKMHHGKNNTNVTEARINIEQTHSAYEAARAERRKRYFESDGLRDLIYEHKKPCNHKSHVNVVDRRKREATSDTTSTYSQSRKKIKNFEKIFKKKRPIKRSVEKSDGNQCTMCSKNKTNRAKNHN